MKLEVGLPPRAVVITVAVDRPDESPGAIAALLDHLDRRRVASTWFVREDVDTALIDRLFFTGHEVAGTVSTPAEVSAVVGALRVREVELSGIRLEASPGVTVNVPHLLEQAAATGLSYVSVPPDLLGETLALPALLAGPLAVLAAPSGPSPLTTNPLAWLQETQLAIGRILEHGGYQELTIDPAALDRPDAVSAVAEAVDLVSGLRRAERLWLDRLDRFVAMMVTER